MKKLIVWIKFFFLQTLFALLLATIGTIAGGEAGAWIGAAVGIAFVYLLNFGSEKGLHLLFRAFPISNVENQGLLHTVQWVTHTHAYPPPLPKLYWAAESAPWAITIRPFFNKKGSLILSKGALNCFSEQELRAFLLQCLNKMQEPELPLQSISSFLLILLLKLAPKKVHGLNSLSFLTFLLFLPAYLFLLRLGGTPSPQIHPTEWRNALIKIRKWQTFHSTQGIPVPGSEPLILPSPLHLDLVSRL